MYWCDHHWSKWTEYLWNNSEYVTVSLNQICSSCRVDNTVKHGICIKDEWASTISSLLDNNVIGFEQKILWYMCSKCNRWESLPPNTTPLHAKCLDQLQTVFINDKFVYILMPHFYRYMHMYHASDINILLWIWYKLQVQKCASYTSQIVSEWIWVSVNVKNYGVFSPYPLLHMLPPQSMILG